MKRYVAVGGPKAGQIITVQNDSVSRVLVDVAKPDGSVTQHVYDLGRFANTETHCWIYKGVAKPS